jgi:hypothetical protein
MNSSEVAKVLDTILSIPSMSENVKVDVKLSRRNVLLLSAVIARGLSAKGDETGLLEGTSKEAAVELSNFANECLQKAGLTDLNEKLKSLSTK